MDLFKLEVAESALHSNFKNIKDNADLRKVINNWCIGFEDRDNKFVKEFQNTFNSSFWEIYLHASFKNLGFKTDYSHDAPDFHLKSRKTKKEFLVEAVATKNPDNGTPEHERIEELNRLYKSGKSDEEIHSEIVHLATERIANSISTKCGKYENRYSKMEHVKGKPFILAIGSFEQPLFYLQGIGAIQRVLYGLTKAEYRGDMPYMEFSDHIIKKSTGGKIPIGLFNDDKHSFISGVIFNPIATVGKLRALSLNKSKDIIVNTYKYNDYDTVATINSEPHTKYRESLLDGTSLFLNPYADNPIDPKEFENPDIAIYHHKNSAKIKHNFLYSRTIIDIKTNTSDIQEML
ncbi:MULTISPECIES: hypothetical protein [Bacillus cereus group]|uniref:hypothetical protein n=1 Tax=Bacillus cereus group TaxID=86661 RepID=UPI001F097995|nr:MULTISPECIES: hypothetical protein [Bacillus cereus group]